MATASQGLHAYRNAAERIAAQNKKKVDDLRDAIAQTFEPSTSVSDMHAKRMRRAALQQKLALAEQEAARATAGLTTAQTWGRQ